MFRKWSKIASSFAMMFVVRKKSTDVHPSNGSFALPETGGGDSKANTDPIRRQYSWDWNLNLTSCNVNSFLMYYVAIEFGIWFGIGFGIGICIRQCK